MPALTGRIPTFTIGDRLRKARLSVDDDLDVRQFAEMLGVDRNTVTNYELEKTRPSKMKPLVLRQWALVTGVDFDWLLNGEAPDESGASGQGRLRESNPRPFHYE